MGQVDWLGLRVGGHLTLGLPSSNELDELLQWPCHDVLLCSLAVLDPRAGHTMHVLSPFISILCHSGWLFHRQSCPRHDDITLNTVISIIIIIISLLNLFIFLVTRHAKPIANPRNVGQLMVFYRTNTFLWSFPDNPSIPWLFPDLSPIISIFGGHPVYVSTK